MSTICCFVVTGYLICNLSVADLGVGLFCVPFTLSAAELRYWPFGLAMCKMLWCFQTMAIMASVATLLAISFGKTQIVDFFFVLLILAQEKNENIPNLVIKVCMLRKRQ